MDNQLFPGGTYLDDMPQVCTLCGVVMNNARALYSHMQLHILSSNLGGQPPDPGLLNPANILDLLAGVAQPGLPSSVPAPMLPPGNLFTPVSSVPNRLITPTLDLGLASLQAVPVPHPPTKSKEKKSSKHQFQNSTSQSGSSSSTSASSRTSGTSGSFQSLPKESKKVVESNNISSKSERSSSKDQFHISAKFDKVDDFQGSVPITKAPYDRPIVAATKSSLEPNQNKDVKLFQPFVTTESSSSLSFLPKSNHLHTSSGLTSPPISRSPDKLKDMDVLNTPQKINPLSTDLRSDDLSLQSEPLSQSSFSGDGRQVNKDKAQEAMDSLFDKMKETPAPPPKTTTSQPESHVLKTQFYPGILDPLNISPKTSQVFPRESVKDVDPLIKITSQTTNFTAKPSNSYQGDSILNNSSQSQTTPMISPKIPLEAAMEMSNTGDSSSNSTVFENRDPAGSIASTQPVVPPAIFGNAPSQTGIPAVGIAPLRSTSPPVLGHTDPTKNPLGTGFFNALTQKLINPGLSMCTDFSKTATPSSASTGSDPSSSKAYYENGVLLNHDYDKISDTNDEDDLERLIDIDPKGDTNIDSKSIDIIDDILNEFNERTEDANKGTKNQLFDLYNVLDDGSSKGKSDVKTDALLEDSSKANTSIIDELLEKEKEQIDREMRENARKQATTTISVSTTISTCTSSTVTFSSTTTTSSASNISGTASVATVNVTESKVDPNPPDDNIDFEIPKVGKLMKIRKYFESQEQKKKEQTQVAEKSAEIKIQQKKEPVVEEKPQLQTVLVQVSKRKKIEYGPYINRQSLLEGKPKEAESTEATPAPVFRPKPRPHVPTRRTFNLRTRKTKTDFASLANKGARNADGKRIVGKSDGKDKSSNNTKDDSEEVDKKSGDEKDTDTKIITRNKAAKKENEKTDGNPGKSESSKKAKNEKEGDSASHSLRTRTNKTETQGSNKNEPEGKSLRKRVVKPSDEIKTKTGKANETSKTKDDSDNSTSKTLRSKAKTTPEKNELKKCSVNLGENLSGPKLKAAALSTVDKEKQKDEKLEDLDKKEETEVIKIEGEEIKPEMEDNNKVEPEKIETDQENVTNKSDETDSLNNIVDNITEEIPIVMNEKEENIEIKEDNPKTEIKSETPQSNIFDVMKKDIESNKEKKEQTNNEPEKKVQVMKLKLGAEIRKSLREIKESLKRKSKDDLQRELETCTRKVTELQKQIQSHKEAHGLFGDKRSRYSLDDSNNEDELSESSSKKVKHSVENEFQRLVDEAVEEVKKAEKLDSGKQERYVNLRKRLNESIRYNVDLSDDESELLSLIEPLASTPKSRKLTPKSSKITPPKFSPKFQSFGEFQKGLLLNKPVKKDVDVYDFTDTELSDKEDATPIKLSSFKPKYVSNIGQKFPGKSLKIGDHDNVNMGKSDLKSDEGTYVGKTVEPLKIKLTKIIPYKEKKHKHKKKKHKRDKDKRKYESFDDDDNDADDDEDDEDDESIESMEIEHENESLTSSMATVSANIQGAKKSKIKTKNHVCAFCNQAFGQKCDLRKHEMIHTGERPWPCEICDKKFQRKTDLAKHIRTHTGEKPYKCEFCDKRVSDKSQLNVHRRLHTGSRPYQCTQCGKGCITSSELNRHKATHRNQTSYKCELCKKVFVLKECLGMHMKLHYKSRGKEFKCDKCVLGFDQLSDLEGHKCADLLPNMFVCGECFAEFTEEVEYGEHVKTHDLDVFSCNICAHVFEEKQKLETHLCSMGVDLQRQIHCEFCDKVFQDQGSLARHMPDHDNDEGSFMCESCPQIFNIRKEFNAHSQKHKISAFICNKCGTGFHDGVRAEAHLQECLGEKIDISALLKQKKQYGDVYLKDEPNPVVVSEQKPQAMSRASVISTNRNFKSVESAVHSNRGVPANYFPAAMSTGLENLLQNVSQNVSGLENTSQTVSQNVSQSVSQNAFVKHEVSTPKQEIKPTTSKADMLESDKIFESSEFSNSPDFSSLTEDVNLTLGLNQFQRSKTNFGSQEEIPVQLSETHKTNIGKGNIGINSLSQADLENKRTKQFPIITSNLQSSHNNAQNDENRWIGSYQMSANDYVNSLLNKMETEASSSSSNISGSSKRSGLKSETNQFSDSFKYSSTSRLDYKDSVESQAKTNIFPDFDFPVSNQKVTDLYQSVDKSNIDSKYTSGATSQEQIDFSNLNINQAAFLSQPSFQDKSDFLSLSNAFLAFPQAAAYSLTGSGSLFGGSAGQNSLKQSGSNSLFAGSQDLMHSNYFLGVEESIKGSLSTDKSDDPAALLSNFDYDLN